MEIMEEEECRRPDVEELPLFRNESEVNAAVHQFSDAHKDWTVTASYMQDKPNIYPSVAIADANKEARSLSLHFIPICSIIAFAPELMQ